MSDAGTNSAQNTAALGLAVWDRCEALAACSDAPGAISRLFLGEGMRKAHALAMEWMTQAGLAVRVDAIGNLIGRRPASREDAPILLFGSHLDTVPNGGKYDGALGVLIAIACMEHLRGEPLPFHVEVIGFSEEEGVRFRLPYLGSRAIAGLFDMRWLDRVDADGVTMRQAISDFGLNPAEIPRLAYDPSHVLGYIEAHIEQGVVLERKGRALGAVSAIAGQNRARLIFSGDARHAGSTPMNLRRDALLAAARMIVAVNDVAKRIEGLRATVGQIQNMPNTTNVVSCRTEISLDVRHAQDAVRDAAMRELLDQARAIAADAGVDVEVRHDMTQAAVPMSPALTALLGEAIVSAGGTDERILSGAGHDAVALAALCPVAMLFIRNPGGVSHHPDEAVLPNDIGAAVLVMTDFIRRLAHSCR